MENKENSSSSSVESSQNISTNREIVEYNDRLSDSTMNASDLDTTIDGLVGNSADSDGNTLTETDNVAELGQSSENISGSDNRVESNEIDNLHQGAGSSSKNNLNSIKISDLKSRISSANDSTAVDSNVSSDMSHNQPNSGSASANVCASTSRDNDGASISDTSSLLPSTSEFNDEIPAGTSEFNAEIPSATSEFNAEIPAGTSHVFKTPTPVRVFSNNRTVVRSEKRKRRAALCGFAGNGKYRRLNSGSRIRSKYRGRVAASNSRRNFTDHNLPSTSRLNILNRSIDSLEEASSSMSNQELNVSSESENELIQIARTGTDQQESSEFRNPISTVDSSSSYQFEMGSVIDDHLGLENTSDENLAFHVNSGAFEDADSTLSLSDAWDDSSGGSSVPERHVGRGNPDADEVAELEEALEDLEEGIDTEHTSLPMDFITSTPLLLDSPNEEVLNAAFLGINTNSKHVNDLLKSCKPPEDGFVQSRGTLRYAGDYIIGPCLGTSPVQSIVQCLARKKGTNDFYTMKILTIQDSVEETQDGRQGKMLLHTEHSLLSMLGDHPGVIKCHGLFQDYAYDCVRRKDEAKRPSYMSRNVATTTGDTSTSFSTSSTGNILFGNRSTSSSRHTFSNTLPAFGQHAMIGSLHSNGQRMSNERRERMRRQHTQAQSRVNRFTSMLHPQATLQTVPVQSQNSNVNGAPRPHDVRQPTGVRLGRPGTSFAILDRTSSVANETRRSFRSAMFPQIHGRSSTRPVSSSSRLRATQPLNLSTQASTTTPSSPSQFVRSSISFPTSNTNSASFPISTSRPAPEFGRSPTTTTSSIRPVVSSIPYLVRPSSHSVNPASSSAPLVILTYSISSSSSTRSLSTTTTSTTSSQSEAVQSSSSALSLPADHFYRPMVYETT